MKNPTFTVVIPMYNAARYIIETLQSVWQQSFSDYEVLIVDDCSTDDSAKIVETYIEDKENFLLHKNKANLGVAKTRNFAIKKARGKYIALLDADDIWHQNKLEIQHQLLIKEDCDITCASYSFIDENSKPIKKTYQTKKGHISYEDMLRENYIGCSTVCLKRELFDTFLFNDKYAHEDYALWLNLLYNKHILIGVEKTLVKYRFIKGSRSNNKIKAAFNRWQVYKYREDLKLLNKMKYFVSYTFKGIFKYI